MAMINSCLEADGGTYFLKKDFKDYHYHHKLKNK